MSALCPLGALGARTSPPLVLDARLALSLGGLSLSLRLARLAEVWLTREFFAIISPDNTADLAGESFDGVDDVLVPELDAWRAAFTGGIIHSAFQWIGDKPYEGRPADAPAPQLLQRYEHLIAHLDPFVSLNTPQLLACGMQSVALAVALEEFAPLLICLAPGGEPLPLGGDLKGSRIVVSEGAFGFADQLPRAAGPVFALVRAFGLDVAFATVMAPRAMLPADASYDQIDPWQGARLFWERAQ